MAFAEIEEELSHIPLSIRGTIPPWLSGTLIRNGPVYVTIQGHTNAHWFDGLAMLHAFAFHGGNVHYTNKFLRTDAYTTVFDKGSLTYVGFASDPCRSLFKRFFTLFASYPSLPNANVNVAKLANRYVALTEIPLPVQFDPHTLETLGVLDYQDKLPHKKCWESAHPHYDCQQKETVNYLIQYGRKSHYVLYRLEDGSNTRKILAQIPVEEPAYMHSFALTERYVVLTEFPFVVKPFDLLTKGQAFIKNFSWHPERGTRFIVVNRESGEVVGTYQTKPFFSFHHANAFEAEGNLSLDLVCYDDPNIVREVADYFKPASPSKDPLKGSQRLERFTLSLKTGMLASKVILKEWIEFPRLNQAFEGRPYRYLYVTDPRGADTGNDPRAMSKVDVNSGHVLKWEEKGCYPGEPVFIPAPQAGHEDEGVVASIVLDAAHHTSFLLLLDGATFIELGRAYAPHFIPAGLHSYFFSIQ